MTHLSVPRIHFKGTFKANPPTANNVDIVDNVDAVQIGILNPQKLTDAEWKRWLMQTTPFGGGVQINAGWNYFGDGSVAFEETAVTSYQPQTGSHHIVDSSDPLAGATVALLGNHFGDFAFATMADLDPIGSYATQLYPGQFQLANAAQTPLLTGQGSVGHSRWVTQWRNLCFTLAPTACIWQVVLPNGNWHLPQTTVPVLNQLATVATQAKGIVVCFAVYTLFPRIGTAELAKRFAEGEHVANPAYGGLVGTIGVWEGDEVASLPVARRLRPVNKLTVQLDCQAGKQDRQPYKGVGKGEAATGDTQVTFPLGAALVAIDTTRRQIVLDLLATFPEINGLHHKVDVGKVGLWLETAVNRHYIGPIAYDQITYEQSAGVVELPWPADITANDLQNGNFVLLRDDDPQTPLIAESNDDWLVVTDNRATYAEIGETIEIELRVYRRGVLAQEAVGLRLGQYADRVLSAGTPENPFPDKQFVRLTPDEYLLDMPETVMVPVGGKLTVQLTARRPGIGMVLFVVGKTAVPDPANIDHIYASYANVRIFPLDNYDDVPDEALTWPFIYRHVFRYFYLLYPAMSIQGFPLNNQPAIERRAPIIKTMVSTALAESSVAMPITRDLSPGKRKLLLRWCDLAGS
ncbi:MAG: hypothetical protein R3C62_17235 [Chloroflexota bacterium]